MIDYDLSNDFSNFLKDTKEYFRDHNVHYPEKAVAEDRGLIMIAYFLSKIYDWLEEERLERKRGS